MSHNDDGHPDQGGGHTPVTFCHKPGTPAQKELTTDDDGFLNGHLAHGDTLGPCPTSSLTILFPNTTTTNSPVTTPLFSLPPVPVSINTSSTNVVNQSDSTTLNGSIVPAHESSTTVPAMLPATGNELSIAGVAAGMLLAGLAMAWFAHR